jgi:hypothetical protein
MKKLYHVVITEIDETKDETVLVDDNYTGLTVVADTNEDRMTEIVLHDNLVNMAAKLAAGDKTSTAVRLAAVMLDLKKSDANNAETALLRAIMGE